MPVTLAARAERHPPVVVAQRRPQLTGIAIRGDDLDRFVALETLADERDCSGEELILGAV
jgi:hypothetical protein